MSKKTAAPGGAARAGSAPARIWTQDFGEPETVLANARRALFVMVGVLAVLWIIQIANWADGYGLTQDYGIKPRDISTLPYILTAPFLHVSWTHIEGNSGPLFIFGFLAAYRGIGKFAAVTAVIVLTSGFAAWFFESPKSVGVGASGVVFGYFGYIMVRGLFDRHAVDVVVGAVMALCFAYQFAVLLPHQGIGWQTHVGGLVGGILSGWLFRDRRVAKAVSAARGARSAARGAKSVSAPAGTAPAGTAVMPASGTLSTQAKPGGQASPTGQPSGKAGKPGKPGKPGKGFAVDPSNPRADLYKELDDLGL